MNELFVYLIELKAGRETIVRIFEVTDGFFLRREDADKVRENMADLARAQGKPIKLVRFERREEVETLSPEPASNFPP